MQTGIDFNASNNNITSITTTITVDNKENDDNETTHFTHSPTTMTAKVSVLINEPPNVLRQRQLQSQLENNISASSAAITTTTTITATTITPTTTATTITTTNFTLKCIEMQRYEEIDVAEYLGSNVQQMAATPSSSPRSSPAKLIQDDENDICGDSTASSTTNSSSGPSMLTTPIQSRDEEKTPSTYLRNGTTARKAVSSENDVADGLQLRRKGQLPPKTLPLPLKTTTFSAFHEFELATPYTPTPTPTPTATVTGTATATSSSSQSTPAQSIPSTTSTSGMPSPIKNMSSEDAQLLHWKDMPQYLQFNPYVLHGYRPLQTFKGCLLSLFYWHNETINILTHAIPIIYILIIVPGLMPWDQGYRFLSFCHLFGSIAPWCGSFVYHLFMNIEKGENVYYRLLKADMVGIWVSQSFGALPLVTATTLCFSNPWKWSIIISYCLLSLWGLYKALTASSPWQRRLCFALPFVMRSILTVLRTMGLVGGNRVTLSHVYLQDGVSILGGAIGAMRIPEKWFPGLVDFYLNSHNIMHVLVVLAVYSMHKATMKDLEWMSSNTCEAFSNVTNAEITKTFETNIEL